MPNTSIGRSNLFKQSDQDSNRLRRRLLLRRFWQGALGFGVHASQQGAYVPVGTLRRAVTYPLPAEDKNVDEITRALKRPFH